MKIAILSCSSKKKMIKATAEEVYSASTLFRLSLKYVKSKDFDEIYILSGKHYLLKLDDIISPYNKTLNRMNIKERREWSEIISDMLNKKFKEDDELYFLTGKRYYEMLHLKSKVVKVLENKRIGERLQSLKLMLL